MDFNFDVASAVSAVSSAYPPTRPAPAFIPVASSTEVSALQGQDQFHIAAAMTLINTDDELVEFLARKYKDSDFMKQHLATVLSNFKPRGSFTLDMGVVRELAKLPYSALEKAYSDQTGPEKVVDEYRAFDLFVTGEHFPLTRTKDFYEFKEKDLVLRFNPVTMEVDNVSNLQSFLAIVGEKDKTRYKFVSIPVPQRMAAYAVAFLYDLDILATKWRCTKKSNPSLRDFVAPQFGIKGRALDDLAVKLSNVMGRLKFPAGPIPEFRSDPAYITLISYYNYKGSFEGFPTFESVGVATENVVNDIHSDMMARLNELVIKDAESWKKLCTKYAANVPESLSYLKLTRTVRSSSTKADRSSHNMFSYAPGNGAMPDSFHDEVRCTDVLNRMVANKVVKDKIIIVGGDGHRFAEVCNVMGIDYLIVDTEMPKTIYPIDKIVILTQLYQIGTKDLFWTPLVAKGFAVSTPVLYAKVVTGKGEDMFSENRDAYDKILSLECSSLYMRFDVPATDSKNIALFANMCKNYATVKVESGIRMHNSECWVSLTNKSKSVEDVTLLKNQTNLHAAIIFKKIQMYIANNLRTRFIAMGRVLAPVPENPSILEVVTTVYTEWSRKAELRQKSREAKPIDADLMVMVPDLGHLSITSVTGRSFAPLPPSEEPSSPYIPSRDTHGKEEEEGMEAPSDEEAVPMTDTNTAPAKKQKRNQPRMPPERPPTRGSGSGGASGARKRKF